MPGVLEELGKGDVELAGAVTGDGDLALLDGGKQVKAASPGATRQLPRR